MEYFLEVDFMKIQYLGTAAAEGIPAIFCDCKTCQKARKLGGKEIRTRSQAIIDDRLLIDFSGRYIYAFSAVQPAVVKNP